MLYFPLLLLSVSFRRRRRLRPMFTIYIYTTLTFSAATKMPTNDMLVANFWFGIKWDPYPICKMWMLVLGRTVWGENCTRSLLELKSLVWFEKSAHKIFNGSNGFSVIKRIRNLFLSLLPSWVIAYQHSKSFSSVLVA